MIVTNIELSAEQKTKYEQLLNEKIAEVRTIQDGSDMEVFLSRPHVTIKDLKQFPNLKLLVSTSAGVDFVPFDYLKKHQIQLVSSKGIHVEFMSEYAIGAMLLIARGFIFSINQQRQKTWDPNVSKLTMLSGGTVTIIGPGTIGKEIAKKAKVFGMKTIGVNHSGDREKYFDRMFAVSSLKEAVREADYVIVVIPLTHETEGLISKECFRAMKDSASLINISRGKIVNETDLLEALDKSWIRFAIMDVFQQEPLPKSSLLWRHPNILVTPHISGDISNYLDFVMEKFLVVLTEYRTFQTVKDSIDLEKAY